MSFPATEADPVAQQHRCVERPELLSIHGATLLCPSLAHAHAAYVTTVGYRVVGHDTLDADLAASWGTPGHADAPVLLLQPPAGDGPFLRFVESPGVEPYLPCSAWGWHALELAVENCDAATDRLLTGGFTLLDAPHELGFSAGALRASQLLGPFGEVLYLTEIRKDVPGYTLPKARSLIDSLFIVVQHGANAADGLAAYSERFGNAASPVMSVDIAFMARLHKCPPGHRYGIGTLTLGTAGYFELDDTPKPIGPRTARAGHLPAGIALVSCRGSLAAGLPAPKGPFYARTRRTELSSGPAGELLEILD